MVEMKLEVTISAAALRTNSLASALGDLPLRVGRAINLSSDNLPYCRLSSILGNDTVSAQTCTSAPSIELQSKILQLSSVSVITYDVSDTLINQI